MVAYGKPTAIVSDNSTDELTSNANLRYSDDHKGRLALHSAW